MAKIIKNKKGFKVIEITAREMKKIGYGDVCDYCGETSENGFYIAALNQWFCPACYEGWYRGATNYAKRYDADARVEQKNFANFKNLLGI